MEFFLLFYFSFGFFFLLAFLLFLMTFDVFYWWKWNHSSKNGVALDVNCCCCCCTDTRHISHSSSCCWCCCCCCRRRPMLLTPLCIFICVVPSNPANLQQLNTQYKTQMILHRTAIFTNSKTLILCIAFILSLHWSMGILNECLTVVGGFRFGLKKSREPPSRDDRLVFSTIFLWCECVSVCVCVCLVVAAVVVVVVAINTTVVSTC